MPALSDVIAGRYRIETKLGQGGMGSVWKAQHLALRSSVAIKLIDPSLASSEEALARFLREAQSAASLRSPHVVQIIDHGVHNGAPYIAMELLEGESLADRLGRLGKLDRVEVARFMTHTARAMSRAHEAGIVHRDLKPDNIFLVRNEDEEIAKVLDFGIAKTTGSVFDVTTGTRTGAMMGTPYYMSPEQVEGSKAIDHRSDLWAMGVITFECVTGVRPFDDDTLGALLLKICVRPLPVPSTVAEVPPGFDAWFARAAERVPDARFQSAREMMDALRAVLTPGANAPGLMPTPQASQLERARGEGETVTRSGVVLRDADATGQARPSELEEPSDLPAGVPRRNRMLGLAIGGVLLAVIAALMLRGGGSRDGAKPEAVRPTQVAHSVPPSPQARQVPDVKPSPASPPPMVATPTIAAAKAEPAPAALGTREKSEATTQTARPRARDSGPPHAAHASSAAAGAKPALPTPSAQPPVLRVSPASVRPPPKAAPKQTDLGF
jgi:serine/threonine-protein kinase